MSETWRTYKLRDLVNLKSGFAFKGTDFISEGVPVLKIKNVKAGRMVLDDLSYVSREVADKAQRYRVVSSDILITMSGNRIDGTPETWVGKVAMFDREGEYLLNQRVGILKVKNNKEVSNAFLSQLLSSFEFQYSFISSATSSGGQANISPQLIYDTEIKLPPIDEQNRIASILSALDDKIELNLQMNATLEAIAQAIFKRWFVDFQFPGFDGALVDGLPKGWKRVEVGELIDSVSITHKFPNEQIIFLNTSDILEGEVLCHEHSEVKTLPGQAKKSIQRNDILYSEIRPANKRYAFIDFDADDYVVSTKLMVLRAKASVDPIVIYYFLKTEDVMRELQVRAESRSGTFPQITFQQLKNLEIIIPSKEVLELYTDILKSHYTRISLNKEENKKLAQIRDSLLPKLMSGKIRVAE